MFGHANLLVAGRLDSPELACRRLGLLSDLAKT